MLVAKQGIQPLIRRYARHNILADGGTCRFLNIEHHNHPQFKNFHRKNYTVHKR